MSKKLIVPWNRSFLTEDARDVLSQKKELET